MSRVKANRTAEERRFYKARTVVITSRRLPWHISLSQFLELMQQPCFYCSGPLNPTGTGLDRLDNDKSIGYRIDNVVPCCGPCNRIRGDNLSVTEMLAAMEAVRARRAAAVQDMFERGVDIDRRFVVISGEITQDLAKTVVNAFDAILAINAHAPIEIRLMSPGGDWDAAMVIYDKMREMAAPIYANVYGQASSSASVILQAADKRMLAAHSFMVVHDGHEATAGTPRDVEEFARASKVTRQLMYQIYSSRSGKPAAFWEDFCSQEQFLRAIDAVGLGLADGIIKSAKKWAA